MGAAQQANSRLQPKGIPGGDGCCWFAAFRRIRTAAGWPGVYYRFKCGFYYRFVCGLYPDIYGSPVEAAAAACNLGCSRDGSFRFIPAEHGRSDTVNPGDLLVLASAVFWAFHVILIGFLVQRLDVLHLAVGQYLVCGLLNMLCGLLFEPWTAMPVAGAWWAVIYTGVVSVGLGYTLQVIGQRQAPPADAAILLSMEAVFAALFGWWLLGEQLNPVQLLGCGIMLAGMLLSQYPVFFNKSASSFSPEGRT